MLVFFLLYFSWGNKTVRLSREQSVNRAKLMPRTDKWTEGWRQRERNIKLNRFVEFAQHRKQKWKFQLKSIWAKEEFDWERQGRVPKKNYAIRLICQVHKTSSNTQIFRGTAKEMRNLSCSQSVHFWNISFIKQTYIKFWGCSIMRSYFVEDSCEILKSS